MRYHLQDFLENPRLVDISDDAVLMDSRALLANEEFFGKRQTEDGIYLQEVVMSNDLTGEKPFFWPNEVGAAETPARVRHLLRLKVLNHFNAQNFFYNLWGGQDLEWRKFLRRFPEAEHRTFHL